MSKGKIVVFLLLVLIGVIIFLDTIGTHEMIPHGYDGVVASVNEVEHDYEEFEEFNLGFWTGIDPYESTDYGPLSLQTGIRCSISSPQYNSELDYDPVTFEDIITLDGVRWWQDTTQRKALVSFEMTAIVQTYGDGWSAIEDVIFWIDLQNNDYSVFTSTNDSAVAILNVYTIGRPYVAQEGNDIEFEPEAGGYDFPLYTIDSSPANIPDESDVNIENFNNLQYVKFPIHILTADPAPYSLIDWTRVECQVEFTIGIDVLLIGEWKQLRPYRETEPPDPDLTWWEQLLKDLGMGVDAILQIFWVICGIVGTIVVFWKIKDLRVALGIVAFVWIIILWQLGFLAGLGI